MSNPAVKLLSSETIKGKRFQVEDNLGEAIHIHIGDLRICMTVKEYLSFVSAVLEAASQLFNLKGLNWDLLDYSSFDWPWLYGYDRIKGADIVKVRLSELYTESFFLDRTFLPIITKIDKSRLYRAFKGDFKGIDTYKQVNMFGITNRQRLTEMYEYILKNGYPFEDKYIMTNQYGLIYDGDHRAACLMKMHGKDHKIPILKLVLDDEKTVREKNKEQFVTICHWLFKRVLFSPIVLTKKIIRKIANSEKKQNKKSVIKLSFSQFIEKLNQMGINYYIVDVPKYDDLGKLISDINIVVQDGLNDIRNMFGEDIDKNPYKNYSVIYSINRPLYYFFEDEKIALLISESLICKSKYESSLLPMDKYVQKYARTSAVYRGVSYYADDCIKCIYILLNALLESCCFKPEDVFFLKNHIDCIKSESFYELMSREVFNFTNDIVEMIEKNEFNSIIEMYEKNTNY